MVSAECSRRRNVHRESAIDGYVLEQYKRVIVQMIMVHTVMVMGCVLVHIQVLRASVEIMSPTYQEPEGGYPAPHKKVIPGTPPCLQKHGAKK